MKTRSRWISTGYVIFQKGKLTISTLNKAIQLSAFKNSENIQKKEGEPDLSVSNNKFSSVTLNDLAKNTSEREITIIINLE